MRLLFSVLLAFVVPAQHQHVDPSICALHQQHAAPAGGMDHSAHAAMEARGGRAMGFDQARASHHFRLAPQGGSIEIHINRPGDDEVRQQIAKHLEAIAVRFKQGDFSIPNETHAGMPDGVEGLKRYRQQIEYAFEPTAVGGRVKITTAAPAALDAVHQFLRYQIREHMTGDPTEVERR